MNKKGFTGQAFVVITLVASAIIALAYIMVGSLATDYNTPGIVNSEFSAHYDKFNENAGRIEEMYNATKSSEGFSFLNTADVLISSTVTIVQLLWSGVTGLGEQVFNLSGDFDIPSPVMAIIGVLIIGVIVTILVFLIINALNKQKPI